jgi:hypothetical protein
MSLSKSEASPFEHLSRGEFPKPLSWGTHRASCRLRAENFNSVISVAEVTAIFRDVGRETWDLRRET